MMTHRIAPHAGFTRHMKKFCLAATAALGLVCFGNIANAANAYGSPNHIAPALESRTEIVETDRIAGSGPKGFVNYLAGQVKVYGPTDPARGTDKDLGVVKQMGFVFSNCCAVDIDGLNRADYGLGDHDTVATPRSFILGDIRHVDFPGNALATG